MPGEYEGAWKGVLAIAVAMWMLTGFPTSCEENDGSDWRGHNADMYDSTWYQSGREVGWGDCERGLPYMYSLARKGWVINGNLRGESLAVAAGWTGQQYRWYVKGYQGGYVDAQDITLLCDGY